MVGTVLVNLPCPHAGGALVVKHNGTEEKFNFAAQSEESGIVQWAGFYSDCLLEVKPVTLGCRVTIAYAIIVRKGHPEPAATPKSCTWDKLTHAAWPITTKPLLDYVVSCLRTLRDDENASAVGIYLSHMYTHEALQPAGMKGADRVLYTHLFKRACLTCPSSRHGRRGKCSTRPRTERRAPTRAIGTRQGQRRLTPSISTLPSLFA
jgi:hypothetical protein